MSNERGYLPRWGELPVKQYLIRHWDNAVPEPSDQQRVRLVRQFLDLDEIPQKWFPTQEGDPLPRTPTEEEIDTILNPWRPADLRRRAWHIYTRITDEPIFLRTHYDPEDDERMERWTSASEEFEDQAWWACLNNAELYNFGSDWQRVYEILPEVAGPSTGGLVSLETLSQAKQIETELWRKDPHRFIELKASRLLSAVTTRYMLLADQEAFETDGRLRLIYLDNKRNIVRETRVDADGQTITDIIMAWFELTDPLELEDGITGDRYRVMGDLGRELYQLTESDLEDP
ncbi:hypothetical protein BDV33DRAFT_187178 [Aspergillus novoparasiticus]|uniref:Uncharacterized protein n=1 Tax=Aspergillus novoparasiticus TaxID=986946 RepID=A0A5N6FAE3_9EURO|nr:hypothetical protein BDV33DRAFT_187178 [Aspergillus novoparasiticus]